jgi:hypothetical protein
VRAGAIRPVDARPDDTAGVRAAIDQLFSEKYGVVSEQYGVVDWWYGVLPRRNAIPVRLDPALGDGGPREGPA